MDFSNQNTSTESSQPDREGAHQKPPLFRLPPEILQNIPDYLPLASAACFSLSCRHVYTMLGTKYLAQLKRSEETYDFLTLLERDIPGSVSCKSCKVLHPIKEAESHINLGRGVEPYERPCLLDAEMRVASANIYFGFSPVVFKMLMKHHSLFGLDNRSRELIKLLSPEPKRTDRKRVTITNEVQVRIESGSLFICQTQTWECQCTAMAQDPGLLISVDRSYPSYCDHVLFKIDPTRRILELIFPPWYFPDASPLEYLKFPQCESNVSWERSTDLFRCSLCRTEYKADMKHESSCALRVTITAWKDLGKGPEGDVWDQHLRPTGSRAPQGEIAVAFERGLP
ncbi:hypothetical protein HYFRA_00011766 [Hymenoscyphus fraxineus]|uniref:F-box domain-containing protein n=1 Tax=Hymenoscyphus fraxineus TaxID=746836 RepID=A0A9N9L6V5_9HELO|nr:hypothetical protein HYFRA_00011766 [Hymenoscyphus fraxineus]